MLFRRVVGVLCAAFMFHLNVAANDRACATHASGHDPVEHASAVMAMAGMNMTQAPDAHAPIPSHAENQTQQCETPVVPSCCQAMVSCSSSYVGRSTSAGWLSMPRAAIVRHTDDAPLSQAVAPDPPPPRV